MKDLLRLTTNVPDEYIEIISDLLLGLEAMAVNVDINSGGEKIVHSIFNQNTDLDTVIKNINQFFRNINVGNNLLTFETSQISRNEWENWKKYLKTVKVTDKIIVRPPWEIYNSEGNEIVVEINPSLAFGTGHHETTQLCIKYLEELIDDNNKIILDVGCGSGILAISSIKLGALRAVCIDTDPKAVNETVSNSHKNNVNDKIDAVCCQVSELKDKFDIVVANISVETLLSIKNDIFERMSNYGYLILSGIPVQKKEEILEGYENDGLKLKEFKSDRGWVALLFIKQEGN